jgi:hypothetical protein
MKPPLWTSLALVVGLLLMIGGPLTVWLCAPAHGGWTNADAQQWGQASANLHAALHASLPHDHNHAAGAAGTPDGHDQPAAELAAAQAEYDRQDARRAASLARRDWLWYGSTILGALLASAGIAGHFFTRRG